MRQLVILWQDLYLPVSDSSNRFTVYPAIKIAEQNFTSKLAILQQDLSVGQQNVKIYIDQSVLQEDYTYQSRILANL